MLLLFKFNPIIKIVVMKNLILAVALSTGTFGMFAENIDPIGQQKETISAIAFVQDGFHQIATYKVPMAISETLVREMPNVTISRVYTNDRDQYKLEVAQEDGTTSQLYMDAGGNWINI
jgi:hypothetical protein